MPPLACVTRVVSFAAAHRMHSPALSGHDNLALYGKCNSRNGHGHNYKVEVTVRGQVDPTTGMVLNLSVLKDCMQRAILDVMDHRNLDLDVPYFKDKVSTAEVIAVFIWEQMLVHLPKSDTYALHQVRLHETDNNIVTFSGEYS
ncbi:hypothetical protein HK105_208314 [Polyrhizophydium stewartii]|uniref:6-pyruvoyltetrahydropterin synthase n=1 Tax=Polyrhizophydium stewartii TaxID=2732419 RepID=A0ABR4MYA7_9FUNG